MVRAGTTMLAPLVTALIVSNRKKSPGRASEESTLSIICTATTVQRSSVIAGVGAVETSMPKPAQTPRMPATPAFDSAIELSAPRDEMQLGGRVVELDNELI